MRVHRYPRTLSVLRERLARAFPQARRCEGATDDAGHTLWMIDRVGEMDEQGKIDRWVGWIAAKAHSLGVIDRERDDLRELRDLAREDLTHSS